MPSYANALNSKVLGTVSASADIVNIQSLPMYVVSLLSSTPSVDLTSVAKVNLYTVPSGKTCMVTHVIIRNASVSLTLAVVGFGFDSIATNYNTGIVLAALTTSTKYSIVSSVLGAIVGAATDIFGILPTSIQTGGGTVTVDVFGYLI